MCVVESLWILRNFFKLDINSSFLIYKEYYDTARGKFLIHKDLQSAITVSPTYELDDILALLQLIQPYVYSHKKILFIDVGAHIGKYTVSVGTFFRNYNNIDFVAFEPDANNFSKNNSTIFRKNITLNHIHNSKLYTVGLGNKNSRKANEFGFQTRKLDDVLPYSLARKYDAIFMKIDIEGYEEDALEGSMKFIKNSKIFYCLTEDCVKPQIFTYMEKHFTFIKKITPYNSFWKHEK